MFVRRVTALFLILSLFTLPVLAQNGNGDLLARIRKEAMEHSQIMPLSQFCNWANLLIEQT